MATSNANWNKALSLRKKSAKVRQDALKRKVDTCFTQLLRKPVNWLRGT